MKLNFPSMDTLTALLASTYSYFIEAPSDQVRVEVGAEVILQRRDSVGNDVDIRLGLLMETAIGLDDTLATGTKNYEGGWFLRLVPRHHRCT